MLLDYRTPALDLIRQIAEDRARYPKDHDREVLMTLEDDQLVLRFPRPSVVVRAAREFVERGEEVPAHLMSIIDRF